MRRGLIYVGGGAMTFVFLFVFALAGVYPLALAAVALTGAGAAGYMTMLSVLVMVASTPEMRGRALGIASMAIGVAPVSMLALGRDRRGYRPVTCRRRMRCAGLRRDVAGDAAFTAGAAIA